MMTLAAHDAARPDLQNATLTLAVRSKAGEI